MALLASPRLRRRLSWLVVVLGAAAVVALVVTLLPGHSNGNSARPAPPSPGISTGQQTSATPSFGGADPTTRREQAKAEAAVRPLADAFVSALVHRRNLARAHALLIPELRAHYALADWEQGRNLPLSLQKGASFFTATVAFSGPTLVGLVQSFPSSNPASSESVLYAMRFKKTNGRWLIDYLKQGHSARGVDETNFAPAGFDPGSPPGSTSSWLPLLLGLIGLVLIVVVIERGLTGRWRRARA